MGGPSSLKACERVIKFRTWQLLSVGEPSGDDRSDEHKRTKTKEQTEMMNIARRVCELILCLIVPVVPAIAQGVSVDQSDAAWHELKSQVQERADALDALIQNAEREGVCTDYALVSKHVIATYLIAAQYDKDHVEDVRKIFQTVWWFKKTDPKEADNLPWNELRSCLDVADNAIAELTRQLDGSVTLSTPPDFSSGKMTLDAGAYRLDGKPVFPHSLVWLPGTPEYMQAFGRIGGAYYQLTHLREDGTVSPWTAKGLVERTQADVANNAAPLVHLIGHAPAKWMVEKHPEIQQGARNFTKYDIDNPLIRKWMDQLCAGVLPKITAAAGDQPQVHLLANEPHFATQKGGWLAKNGVSDLTVQKFRQWIAAKYVSIDAANQSHGAEYVSFADVNVDMPIDPALRGTAVWYDWCRFNMGRVNEWFTFLKTTTQRHDPQRSPVSIKTLGHTLGSSERDGGMDIEYLTKLQEIPGSDLRVVPQGTTFYGKNEDGRDTETGWASRYAYLWVDQSMVLDFTKSLCPDRPFYDSEWHGFGTVSWRHYHMNRPYVRSAMWLAFTHGMSMINPWLWGRGLDGGLNDKADHIGELATQPIAVDAYGRVMKELNAHAADVIASVPSQRDIVIFYCEDSAIQDPDYMPQVTDIYEALKLTNMRIGFVTPSGLEQLSEASQTLVVPPTPFIADETLAKVVRFCESGGRSIFVEQEKSFVKNELGFQRDDDSSISPTAAISTKPVLELAGELEQLLMPSQVERPLDFKITDENGAKTYGVFLTQSVDPATGMISVAMNNVSKDPRVVKLRPNKAKSGVMIDAIDRNRVSGIVNLQPCEVRLLKATLK